MRPQAEIEQSIRDNLPIFFGTAEAVDQGVFLEKYNELADHAAVVSEPFLRAETVRYQSILLYVSLLFLSVSIFRVKNLRISENALSVDSKFLAIYTVFIATIALIFALKSYVDYQRSRFVRSRTDHLIHQVRDITMSGVLTKRIQQYFWQELFDVIGRTWDKTYEDALAKAQDRPPLSEQIATQSLTLDPLRDVPELATEIALQEEHLATMVAELAQDEMCFRNTVEALLRAARARPPYEAPPPRSEHIRLAFDQCLSNWFEARNALALSLLKRDWTTSQEERQMDAILDVVRRISNIRRIYGALEVLAPVAFAFLAILYVWCR